MEKLENGQCSHHVPGEHRGKTKSRTAWIKPAERRQAGWTRDGSTEEIASWSVEAERLSRSGSKEEETPRGDREIIHNERRQDVGRRLGWSGWVSVVVKVPMQILQAISDWKRFAVRKRFGPVEWCDRPCAFESVELERGWTVGGFNGHFLSQISMLTDWDVLLLQECFRKLDGVKVGAHERFTPSELRTVIAQQSQCVGDGVDNQELLEERADGLRSSWMCLLQ